MRREQGEERTYFNPSRFAAVLDPRLQEERRWKRIWKERRKVKRGEERRGRRGREGTR